MFNRNRLQLKIQYNLEPSCERVVRTSLADVVNSVRYKGVSIISVNDDRIFIYQPSLSKKTFSVVFLKDPLDVNEITGIIYQVLCHDCPFVYIDQTKRDLKSRLSEHKRAIKYQRPEKSTLCEHSITLDHLIDLSEATILSTEKDYTKRLFAERWLINKNSNVINRNDGNTLPSVYKRLL